MNGDGAQSSAAAAALLDAIEIDNRDRDGWAPAISRDSAAAILDALVWLYGARSGSAASIYAADALGKAAESVWAPSVTPDD
ncbi:hypothetical protein GGC65_002550 [Sphingopyxis sp. OAS728]|uniref:hypothetical protein n=1 Tax=Sphingopyxis sp. OAS728 TaxID=2663823 RepID=UPI00178987F6|nr:hypothetical protein [Sphingopyxis sp. OAS728]MBE1528094.1 hypothetical protein [Sphingopyxis sp. OAS728]